MGWGGPSPTCWLVALGALGRRACAGEDCEVLAADDGEAEGRPCSPGDDADSEREVLAAAREVTGGGGPGTFTRVRVPPATAVPAPDSVRLESLTCASRMAALVHLWHVHNWHLRWPECTLKGGHVTASGPVVGVVCTGPGHEWRELRRTARCPRERHVYCVTAPRGGARPSVTTCAGAARPLGVGRQLHREGWTESQRGGGDQAGCAKRLGGTAEECRGWPS
jgi:hypothetical protein